MPYKDPAKQREYARRWVAARRAEFMHDKSCAWCGSSEQLELDHIDPATKVDHRIWSWSRQRREEEIAKCQVLCVDCHKIKTNMEKGVDVAFRHGTDNGYQTWKCRCDLCRSSHVRIVAEWRYRTGRRTKRILQ